MTEKLQKVLARNGLGSRREIEAWIVAGRISINGQLAQLGDRIDDVAKITLDGKPVSLSTEQASSTQAIVLIYHKPEGEVCTRKDPENRPTVFARLPKLITGRWVMVGRLDFNTSGLLLFTNDGELAHKLMHPSFHLTRVYAVRIFGEVNKQILRNLQQGVQLEDGRAQFDTIESMEQGKTLGKNQWYQVSVSSGRNRIVRRLWESQGLRVNRLIRLQYGPIHLPKNLQPGSFVQLSAENLKLLIKETKSER